MRLARFLVALVGIAVGVAAEWGRLDAAQLVDSVADLVVGWVLIACGLAALARPPFARCGWLLVMAGLTWFVPNFADIAPGLAGTIASASLYLHRGFIVHLLLAYPSGTVTSRFGFWAVVAGYAAAITPTAWAHWRSAVVLSIALIAATAVQYRRSRGVERPARLAAIASALALGSLVSAVAILRMAPQSGLSDKVMLRAYEATLVTISLTLTLGMMVSWSRPDRVTDLVIELGRGRSPDIREQLAKALGDPNLLVGYWLPEAGQFVDFEGRPLPTTAGNDPRLRTTLLPSTEEPVAAIVHDTAALDQGALLQAVAAAARLAAANARLRAEVRARVNETVESRRRLVEASHEERERLGRRLRDGAERKLHAVVEDLRRARESAGTATIIDRIGRGEEQVARTQDELVRLARGLHPRALAELGLASALAGLADLYPLTVNLDVVVTEAMPEASACAYFVCAEALANAAKHSSASVVRVVVRSREQTLHVTVSDDGIGGAAVDQGTGLGGLADRVEALGGTFSVDSSAGAGTVVKAIIPSSSRAPGRRLE
jgi:signal transduction histidine kinase